MPKGGTRGLPRPDRETPRWVLVVGGGVFAFGVVLIVAGGVISGLSEYMQSVLANVGTAVLLVSPLFVVEKVLGTQVRAAREEAAAVQSAVQEATQTLVSLESRIDEDIKRRRLADKRVDEARRDAAQQGDFGALAGIVERAFGNDRIDADGLRVPAGPPNLWMRARLPDGSSDGTVERIELSFEDGGLRPVVDSQQWAAGDAAAEVFDRLIEALRGKEQWPGDDAIKAGELLDRLVNDLDAVIELHAGQGENLGIQPVIELPASGWAVTRGGLESTRQRGLNATSSQLMFGYQREEALGRLLDPAAGDDEEELRTVLEIAAEIHKQLRHWDLKALGDLRIE